MSTINSHVVDFLDYYLSLANPPQYAVLLRGDWGSGKSWFIKDYIAQHPEHQYLEVSLYGITSYKEIEDAFYVQLHPFLGSQAAKLTGKLLRGLLKTTLKVDLDGDHKVADATVNLSIPEFVNKFDKSAENRVLVFEDLERCSINLTDLLGYINQYVENYGLKVILVANETEIIEKTKFTGKEESAYLRIKEKLIGKSFDVGSDVDRAIGVFIGETRGEKVPKLLNKHKPLIKDLYETAGYNNLRHLKQTIMDFDRFYDYLPSDAENKPDLLSHLINLFFSLSIEVKKGAILAKDIPKIFLLDYQMKRAQDEPTKFQKINNKYPVFKLASHPVDHDLMTEFFQRGTVDKDALKRSIENSAFFAEERKPVWVKLFNFDTLEDAEFVRMRDTAWSNLQNSQIEDKYIINHIVGELLYFASKDLFDQDRSSIIKKGKEQLDRLKSENKFNLTKFDKAEGVSAYGAQYFSIDQTDFQDYLKYFYDIIASA